MAMDNYVTKSRHSYNSFTVEKTFNFGLVRDYLKNFYRGLVNIIYKRMKTKLLLSKAHRLNNALNDNPENEAVGRLAFLIGRCVVSAYTEVSTRSLFVLQITINDLTV